MDYREYVEGIRGWGSQATIREYGSVRENGRDYPLLTLTTEGSRELVVTAGFHGEEPAGPLTLLESFGELAEEAGRHDVALRVFPCVNPSGFEAGHRYNASGENPNNDFIRYEVSPGVIAEEVLSGQPFVRWLPYTETPKETRALYAELSRLPAPAGALDLHQDDWVKAQCLYAYYFGDEAPYRALVEESLAYAKKGVHFAVHNKLRTNRHGLIVHHDGSNSDWFHRRGVPYVAVLETSTVTPPEKSHAINRLWVKGLIRLVAARPS